MIQDREVVSAYLASTDSDSLWACFAMFSCWDCRTLIVTGGANFEKVLLEC